MELVYTLLGAIIGYAVAQMAIAEVSELYNKHGWNIFSCILAYLVITGSITITLVVFLLEIIN